MYLLLLGPPIYIFSRLPEHHYPHKSYGPGVKHRGAMEYRKRIINKVAPFWKCGFGGNFHKCLGNVLAAHHHARAVKENLAQRKKERAPKSNANIVPNDYWVTSLLPFIDQNVHRGKINVTHNRGLHAPRNFDQHETRTKNKKAKEDAAAAMVAAAAAAKNKGIFYSTRERES
jgi:hypothetical protein